MFSKCTCGRVEHLHFPLGRRLVHGPAVGKHAVVEVSKAATIILVGGGGGDMVATSMSLPCTCF